MISNETWMTKRKETVIKKRGGKGNMMWQKKRRGSGFTLAELLIVVAIIAVLVAVSIPIFTSQLEKARRAVDMSNARNIRSALANAVNDGTIVFNNKDAELAVFVGKNNVNGSIVNEKNANDVVIGGKNYNGQGAGYKLVWEILKQAGISDQLKIKQKSNSVDWYGVSLDGYGRCYYYEGKGNMSSYRNPNVARKYDWTNLTGTQ